MNTHIFSRFFKSSTALGATPTPHLERRAEFEEILRDYKPSPQTIAILAKTPLVTLTAPTATGRNTIINELIKTGRYHFLISDTTRPPRPNNGVWERNGVEYFFRNEDEIFEDIKARAFVEAEVIHSQQVSGTSAREVERASQEGKIAITDMEIEGGVHIAELKPDAITICLVPPSFDTWMARIKGREKIEDLNLFRRLRGATKVFKLALANDHFIFIVNDKLCDAVKAVDAIATTGQHNFKDEQKARAVAEKLYAQTVAYLRIHAPDMVPAAWHS